MVKLLLLCKLRPDFDFSKQSDVGFLTKKALTGKHLQVEVKNADLASQIGRFERRVDVKVDVLPIVNAHVSGYCWLSLDALNQQVVVHADVDRAWIGRVRLTRLELLRSLGVVIHVLLDRIPAGFVVDT